MSAQRISVLLIDGKQTSAGMLSTLSRFRTFSMLVDTASTVEQARGHLRESEYDLVLIATDDTHGGATPSLQEVRRIAPACALVALEERSNPVRVGELLKAGADDVWSRTSDPATLESAAVVTLNRCADAESQLQYLVRLARRPPTAVTSSLFGSAPLRTSHPGLFDALVTRYTELLDAMLEAVAFRIEDDHREQLRALAYRLGELNAGPRDVIELHTAALGQKIRSSNPAKVRGYVEEGKILVLELMGYLVSFYRSQALTTGRQGGSARQVEEAAR